MPLLDHFHPPLSTRRHWESLHATWTVCLADALAPRLPEPYFVEVQTHAGPSVEIDVGAFEEPPPSTTNGAGRAAVAPRVETLPPPVLTMPAVYPEDFEVRVFRTADGPKLVGAIEIVSPANKDRPETRRAFAIKCASYLHAGISLIVVDIVTERQANLHNETMTVMGAAPHFTLADQAGLYAVAYRPVRREQRSEIDLWPAICALGAQLPALPLYLQADLGFLVDLEAAYADACQRRGLR